MEGKLPFAIFRAWGCKQGMKNKVQQQMEFRNMKMEWRGTWKLLYHWGVYQVCEESLLPIFPCEQSVNTTRRTGLWKADE